ncbi:MAG TPA: RDD family protein [Conexibacter sp.]|nr:RDD family protein [Conexibacter sp.]
MSSAQTLHAQEVAARRAGAPSRPRRAAPLYPGLATRAVALALDAVVINAVAFAVGGVIALCTSLLHLPEGVERVAAIVGAGLWLAWSIGYFAVFWSTTGQTPGDRVMRICVRDAHEPPQPLRLGRALVRFGALVLGAIPLFAGYLPVLLDARRRAFHDRVATTVVVHEEPERRAVTRAAAAG